MYLEDSNVDLEVLTEEKRQSMSSKKLDAWLLQNLQIMQELTVKEPVCWREVDTPG